MPATEPWLNLLIQIPIVGIFIWFVLEQMKMSNTAQSKRDEEWRIFLGEQRDASNLALARLAEEIKSIAQQVATMQSCLQSHDNATRTAVDRITKSEKL